MFRRQFIQQSSILALSLGAQAALPAWAQSGQSNALYSNTVLSGKDYELTVREVTRAVAGRSASQILINEQLPAPLLRWQEGDDITLRVNNHLSVNTSVHWHGILLPFQMDGVPGISFPGIAPGNTYEYSFPVKQAGTYWYHSHSGLQEQQGLYGPIIIDPLESDPVNYDREYVLVLSDWSYDDPHQIFSQLKKMSDSYNFQKRTLGDFFDDAREQGLGTAIKDRAMWGAMRMSPADISDVTGEAYTYLINGQSALENWTGLFKPGEKVRLRFINASAMTIFNIRIPGLPVTVVQADGLNVQPVEIDEFQIGVAETFDVIVNPQEDKAYSIYCETNDRSGFTRATLAPREGMVAVIPALRERPLLSMRDMGMSMDSTEGVQDDSMVMADKKPEGMSHNVMDHGAMDHDAMGQDTMNNGSMDHGSMNHSSRDQSSMDHSAMTAPTPTMAMAEMPSMDMNVNKPMYSHNHVQGFGVTNVAMNPLNRLSEPALGLEDLPHRVLVYSDLQSLEPNPDQRAPERELELHLTGNMERYMWSFDGIKFSEVESPIEFVEGERLRLTMVNDTMMPHPIHLHGMFFELVTAEHNHKPRKHTVVIKPGERLSVDITADAVGDWAFHCHLLYHMHAGMMQVVAVKPAAKKTGGAA